MNNIASDPDATEHYDIPNTDEIPSLLAIVLDTNPRAWAALEDTLPLSRAVANLLIFINGHLAFSNANQVAVIASHTTKASWLYPPPHDAVNTAQATAADGEDVHMRDAAGPGSSVPPAIFSANKFPLFAQVEAAVASSLAALSSSSTPADLTSTTTKLSGALTMALSYINRVSQSLAANKQAPADSTAAAAPAAPQSAPALGGLRARILVLSVSDSQPSQYIPTMNAVFAASHLDIPIDTLSISGNDTFMQQAAFITEGTFLRAAEPRGILQYLMTAFMPDGEARAALISPRHHTVDFRAACFCHGRVVDTGFVCSVCLGIFCEPPPGAECLLCGNKLRLGSYGGKPAVVPRKKKKRRKINGREETGSATGTPRP
ncbi:related to basic transcription factor 2 (35 kd SU) [Cephalotrichum gorgonifer]|uniref:General transcription and DNA repair factor IIH subunit TFB4 n=1 Tax=Cephalotrichum gorgonifer TaxID=2041049 RepID=A0AAE8SWL9_9PEZI|nr:related to basic transcription factor 2 (35 kd SU) [Cephalotrichum gorgonifer]